MWSARWVAAWALACGVVACGPQGDSSTAGEDAGENDDARAETGAPASRDGGGEGGVDPRGDAAPGADAASGANAATGTDAATDADAGASRDAGIDASSGEDAAVDGSDSGTGDASVEATCGGARCFAGQVCQAGACAFVACVGTQVPGDYATVQAAVDALSAVGGTICLAAQAFAEDVTLSAGKPLTFQGVSAAATSVKSFTVTDTGGTFVGLWIQSFQTTGTTAEPADEVRSISVLASKLGDTTSTGITFDPSWGTLNVLVDECEVIGSGIQIQQNSLEYDSTLVATVQNSYLHDTAPSGFWFQNFTQGGAGAVHAQVTLVNDTFESNGTAIELVPQSPGWTNTPGALSVAYYNNVIHGETLGVSITEGVVVSHGNNALFANTTNYGGAAVDGPGYVKTDPELDTSTAPPGLLPGSPCRAAGDVTHAPAHDYFGAKRGASVDIGAVQSSP